MQLELWSGAGGGLAALEKETADLLACNPVLQRYGLELSPRQARALAVHHQQALGETGRITFGQGITPQLAAAFCDSPYIDARTLADTLAGLTDVFYHFKNEMEERLTDEELIAFMESRFNGVCQGSLELLRDRELEALARLARGGEPEEEPAEEPEEPADE